MKYHIIGYKYFYDIKYHKIEYKDFYDLLYKYNNTRILN